MTDTYLAPIENPPGLIMKLVYYFSRRQFGKVPRPLSVHAARLPLAFGMFYGKVSTLDEKLQLPPELAILIRQRVAALNVCLCCMDISHWFWIRKSMKQAEFDALDHYATSPLFTEAERVALDYPTELTTQKKVSADTFARMAHHHTERATCEIVWLVASEHLYNMTNLGLNIHSDMLCDISRKRANA